MTKDVGRIASGDRAGGPADLSRQGVSAKGAHPLRGRAVIMWDFDGDATGFVIARIDDQALRFGDYAAAKAELARLGATDKQDSGPAWTPKSGGY